MTKPIILVKICYKLVLVKKKILISNFLASADIKVWLYIPIYIAASD